MSNFIKCNGYHTNCVSTHKLKSSFENMILVIIVKSCFENPISQAVYTIVCNSLCATIINHYSESKFYFNDII